MIPATLETYEHLCDYARSYSDDLDNARWKLGDCANTINTRYGDKSIEMFAKDIGQRKSTLYQYAKVAEFYSEPIRIRLLDDMPNLNYSTLRDSMRLGTLEAATAWLEYVSTNGFTVDESSRRLTEKLGHKTIDTFEGEIHGYGDYDTYTTITIKVSRDDMEQLLHMNRVVIKAK